VSAEAEDRYRPDATGCRQEEQTAAPVEAADELPMHEDAIALGDPVQRVRSDRGVARGDREARRRLPASGTESRSSVSPHIVKVV
jgi:hypothetical protein